MYNLPPYFEALYLLEC